VSNQGRKASAFLPSPCRLVFKLSFATSTMLWTHLLQKYNLYRSEKYIFFIGECGQVLNRLEQRLLCRKG